MAVNQDGSRMIAVGNKSIAVVDFDGTTLTTRSQFAIGTMARGVAFNADATMAIVTLQTGGAALYSIAADGTMTQVDGYGSTSGSTRAVLFTTHP
jgi:DNA-binding beta-propeller fold protein YncE